MSYPPQQPGPYGPGGYPQQPVPPGQPGFTGGSGYPGGGPPRRRNTGMIAAIAIVAVLVVGGVVAAIVLTSGDDKETSASGNGGSGNLGPAAPGGSGGAAEGDSGGDEDEVRAVAQAYVDAITDKDEAAATKLTCDKAGPGSLYDFVNNADGQIELATVKIIDESSASGDINMIDADGKTTVPGLLLTKKDGWC